MKKAILLIMSAMFVMVACNKENKTGDASADEQDNFSQYAFKARLANTESNDQSIGLTAYDEEKGVSGNDFVVSGMAGDVECFFAYYRVLKVSGGIAILDMDAEFDNTVEDYDKCEYFNISSVYDGSAFTDENGNVPYGPLFANTCSKEEMDALISREKVLDLYMLNSIVRVKLTVTGNDAPLTVQNLDVLGDDNFVYDVDYGRLDEMIQDGKLYPLPESSTCSTTAAFSSSIIPAGGGTCYLHFSAAPGKLSNLGYVLYMEDDRFCIYSIEIGTIGVVTAEAGKVSTVELYIGRNMLEDSRYFVPHILVDDNSYEVNDSGYGMDNAGMISDLLKTSPWVYIQKPGEPEDYSGTDVRGKVVLVDRGKITFSEKVLNASAAGAVGIIIVNNQAGIFSMDLSAIEYDPRRIPALAAPWDLGLYLLEHPDATISLKASL